MSLVGIAFPTLMETAGQDPSIESEYALGKIAAINVGGSIAGALVSAFWLPKWLGLWNSMIALGVVVIATGLIARMRAKLAATYRISSSAIGAAALLCVGAASFFIVYGVGIGFCGWGLLDLHRWARGPTLLIELLNLGLGWSLRGGSTWGAAVALAIPSVVVLVCVLLPASVEALETDGGREPRS